MVAEVEDEGSSARRTFFCACGRGSWILKRKKEFFRGNLWKKAEKVLPRVPAEEGSEGSSAGSSGRWFRRFFRGLQWKNYVFRGSRGRTCGTFFRRQHFLLAEELVELLPQASFPSRGRTFETSSAEHVFVIFGYFF